MPAKKKQRYEAVTKFDTIRFRFFITVAMRAILIRDGIATLGRASKPVPTTLHPTEECTVMSGTRRLDARLVSPVAAARSSMLILHGIGERLAYWHEAQQFLAGFGVASLIIDYSGYGRSDGAITPANLQQDAVAGYAELRRLVPGVRPPFVLGLSLGTGVAVDAAPYFKPTPSGIVLCEAFSTLRDAAVAVGSSLPVLKYFSRWLAMLVPDVYRTALAASCLSGPLLIVHSDADELFPVEMARQILAVASSNPDCAPEIAVLHRYTHNDAYLRPASGYWQPVLDFIGRDWSHPDPPRHTP